MRTEGRTWQDEFTGGITTVMITSSRTRNLTAKIVEFIHHRSPDFVLVFWIFKISSSLFELSSWSIPRDWKWDFLISPCTTFKYCHSTRTTVQTGYIAVDSVMGLQNLQLGTNHSAEQISHYNLHRRRKSQNNSRRSASYDLHYRRALLLCSHPSMSSCFS